MPADPILVIDAGTSALRAVAVTADGSASVVGERAWPVFTPPDAEPFGREFEGVAVRDAMVELLNQAAGQRFAAVAVTGQREGLVFVDELREPLLVSPNVDARAAAEGIAIDAGHAAKVYATTGHLPSLMQAPAKLEWLRRNRPESASRVRCVIPLADWLASVLTGTLVSSRTLAAENGLVDVANGSLAADLLSTLDLDHSLLPSLAADGAIAGAVASGPPEGPLAGPLAGTPLVLAGADTQCALVGMGAVSPGDAAVPAGWSAPLQLVTESPILDDGMRTWTGVHVVPGQFVLESNAGDTGRAWQWMCDLVGLPPHEAQCLAAHSPPGAGDVMTVLGPRAMNAAAMNAGVGGVTLPLPLVMSSAGRADALRSVLESIAYAIRANLEQLEAISGARVDSLRLGAGMSQSPTFAQIVADVLDRPVAVASTPHTTAVGAAALAFVALGVFPTIHEACDAMAHGSTVRPDPRRAADYDDFYARWCAMADAFDRMAAEA